MSLVVWLPLTKDLRNQGLSNVTVTNNGATFNSAGKLGGCYGFGNGSVSSNGLFLNSNLVDLMQEEYSVAVWVKPLGNHYHYNGTIFSSGNWNNTCYAFGLSQDNSQVDILCKGYNTYLTCAVPVNTWTHLVCTCDTNNVVRLYKNGEYIGSSTRSNKPDSDNATQAAIGRETYASGYFTFNGMLNDFRLYDHCLSPMEVKKLSQGLVLHYPLNRQGWGQENFILESHKVTSGGNANGITRTYESDGSMKIVSTSGNGNYASLGFAQNSNTSVGNNMVVGDTYCISCDVKIETGTALPTLFINSGNGYKQLKSVNGSIITNKWMRAYYTSTWAEPGTQYGNISLHLGFSNAIGTYYFKNFKLEKGSIPTPWCPNSSDVLATTMDLNSTTEYDCSGFCNNGIKNNLPTYSSDTAKYNVSTYLNGVRQTIQLPNLSTLIPDSIFTFNIWFKRLESDPSAKPWETIFGGPGGFEIETCSANNVHDNKIKAYSWGGGTFSFDFDKWNMLTMVSNGTNTLFYLNGELKLTGTYKALVSGNYFLGSWRDTATQNYRGYMCDARIYATALSADDVKSLYQNCATIDADGTIHGQIRS